MALAAVISLMNAIENLTDPSNPQIISAACDELNLLRDALTRCGGCGDRSSNSRSINPLDDRIREAIRNLEDVLHQQVTEEIRSCLEMLKNLREEYITDSTTEELDEQFARERKMKEFGESKMIVLSDQFEEIKQEILGAETLFNWNGVKALSLYGMAGIGKTFLAREIYQHPKVVEKFELRVWVTLGPKPCIANVLIDIAAQIGFQLGNQYTKDGGVTDFIRRNLYGRTYFIVLDDIWSDDIWRQLRIWFPDPEKYNLGLLLLTTRQEELAKDQDIHHEMRFLDQEESWNLLCRNVIIEDKCPPELEEAGMMFVEQCEGLPLLILEVARLLSAGEKDPNYFNPEVPLLIVDVARVLSGEETTQEFRNEVGKKLKALFQDARRNIVDILYSSYEHLVLYLQECFLYMAAFPQNYEIPLPKLIHLWIAEDFVQQNRYQTLEDFAVGCLSQLVSQSLVIVSKRGANDMIKSAKLHSTYWQLCVDEARKTKFLHVLGYFSDGFDESIESQSRLSVQNNVLFGIKEVYDSMAAVQTTHSLLCTGKDEEYPVPICFDLMSLKVLDALAIRFYEFPGEVLKLLSLKYLALTYNGHVPSSISELQNLQTLILRQHHNMQSYDDSNFLPQEIWDMRELRHVRIMGSNLPDPSEDAQLPKLLTLHVTGQSCTEKVFRSTPELKKLGIKIEIRLRSTEILNCFEHIATLKQLESLKCVVVNPRHRSQVVAPPVSLPDNLKKVSLSGLGHSWEHMSVIGSLPNLQVLKLRCSAFRGPEWETKAEEFQELKYLLLEDIDLELWTAEDGDCFQCLQHLIIRHCYKLEEIPDKVGGAPTLKRIEVFDCNPLIVDSANEIKQEEEDNGNFSLQVQVSSF